MLHDSPHATSMRSHLNCSQLRVEQAISSVQASMDSWCQKPNCADRWQECIKKVDELKLAFDDHIARIAGEGVLEDAVDRHPSLYATLRSIESWQENLSTRLASIIARMYQWNGNEDEVAQIGSDIQKFRQEFMSEEREERHLADRGLGPC